MIRYFCDGIMPGFERLALTVYKKRAKLEERGGVLISAYQRIVWFHNRVVENVYPNAGRLAERFEISNRQAQRDIEYMRDSMNAPLVYCGKERGYRYEKEYLLPNFFLSESEKETVRLLAKQSRELNSFGYGKFQSQAEILSKISAESENTLGKSSMKIEPYFAEIEMVGSRTSVVPLEYFLCEKTQGKTCTYAFYDPDVFISVLIAGGLDFRILKPNWLREHMKERISKLLLLL